MKSHDRDHNFGPGFRFPACQCLNFSMDSLRSCTAFLERVG